MNRELHDRLKSMNTYIFDSLSIKVRSFMNQNQQLQLLAKRYYVLMSIEEPSDGELHQLEEILELATIDEEVNNLLLMVDEYIAIEAGLISEEQVQNKSSLSNLVSVIAQGNLAEKTKRLLSISMYIIVSIGTSLVHKQCDVIHVKLRYYMLTLDVNKTLASKQTQDTDASEQKFTAEYSLLEQQTENESKKIDFVNS